MKLNFSHYSPYFFKSFVFCVGRAPCGRGAIKNWINTSGGTWFDPLNWSPNGVPTSSDAVTITNNGTYTVVVSSNVVTTAVFTIGGASGRQTLLYGSTAGFASLFVTNTTVQANGVLIVTNWALYGALTVNSGGELVLGGSGNFNIYGLAVTNQGTLTCTNGGINIDNTYITNTGLWQISSNSYISHGGSNPARLFNAGTLRKLSDSGSTTVNMDVINLPSGNVDVLAGTLVLAPATSNQLSSSFTVASPGILKFTGIETRCGTQTSVRQRNSFQVTSGTFYLRTNTIANLKFTGCDIYVIGTSTFQQAGAITNLTLDGPNTTLRGTNLNRRHSHGQRREFFRFSNCFAGRAVGVCQQQQHVSVTVEIGQPRYGQLEWGSLQQLGTSSISNGGVLDNNRRQFTELRRCWNNDIHQRRNGAKNRRHWDHHFLHSLL